LLSDSSSAVFEHGSTDLARQPYQPPYGAQMPEEWPPELRQVEPCRERAEAADDHEAA
jgi:hypothetical protein